MFGYTPLQLIIIAIVIAGAIAVLYTVVTYLGIAIPTFVVRIFWIIVIVVVGVFAVKLLAKIAKA